MMAFHKKFTSLLECTDPGFQGESQKMGEGRNLGPLFMQSIWPLNHFKGLKMSLILEET